MKSYNHEGEFIALTSSLRHPADPTRQGGTERRILCADGHWRSIASCRQLDKVIMRRLDLANMRKVPVESAP